MSPFRNGLSEAEFLSLVDFHLDDVYRTCYRGETTSLKSIEDLLDHGREVVGRVMARLILDEDLVLSEIDVTETLLTPIQVVDRFIIDQTFRLIEIRIKEYANELLTGLDEEADFD